MREIKFRGKTSENEWEYGGVVINPRGQFFITTFIGGNDVDPKTVGQYTGLKDKNSKEIFEGDIVVVTYGKWHEEPKGLTRICKVIYDNKTCSFKMAVNNSKVHVGFGDSRSKDIEVIGNIYDNSNLLKY